MSRDGLGWQQVVVIPSSYKEEERLEAFLSSAFLQYQTQSPNTADIEQGGQTLPKPYQCASETAPRVTVRGNSAPQPQPEFCPLKSQARPRAPASSTFSLLPERFGGSQLRSRRNPSRPRQEEFYKFKASLGYIEF